MEWLLLGASLLTVAVILVGLHRPLGDYMAWVFTSPKHWRLERGLYRVIGVKADAEQSWPSYLRSVLAFSAVGILLVYSLQRTQQWLPFSLGLPPTSEHLAFNTAVSFVTNTNWQSYSPELTLGYSVQLVGSRGAELRVGCRRHRGRGRAHPRLRLSVLAARSATSGST